MDIQIVIDVLNKIFSEAINFTPNLINSLIILLIGYMISWITRRFLVTVIQWLKLDFLIERIGVAVLLRNLGIDGSFSQIFVQMIFALLLLSFIITSMKLIGVETAPWPLVWLVNILSSIIGIIMICAVVILFFRHHITALKHPRVQIKGDSKKDEQNIHAPSQRSGGEAYLESVGFSLTPPIHQIGNQANSNEQQHSTYLVITKQKRLRVLERQAAHFGIDCPAHITIEIEDLCKEIEDLCKEIENLQRSGRN